LTPGLFPAASHEAFRFGRGGSGATIGKLHNDRGMQEMGPGFDSENLFLEFGLDNVDRH
jgi:hypothetical protein